MKETGKVTILDFRTFFVLKYEHGLFARLEDLSLERKLIIELRPK